MGSAKHFMSWQEIDHCVLLLRDSLQNQEFDEIVGITRGGLVAGVLLAHALGMRSMSVIELQITHDDSIESEKFDDVRVMRLPERDRIAGRRVLLADDIVGSGRTMMKARQLLVQELAAASLQSCALVVNEGNLTRPLETFCDHVGCRLTGWTVFPWEYEPAGVRCHDA
jgi:hypoxanthine phosphoribosyltransferase